MKKNSNQGFTLVELLVAIGIFSILVAIGVGGFVNALHTQRQVAGLIAAQSNASIALEQMAREMRTGLLFCNIAGNSNATVMSDTACQQACTLSSFSGLTGVWTCNNFIDFYDANAENIDYEVQNGSLARSNTGPNGTFTPITGSAINVRSLTFTLFGNVEDDHWNPRITISLGVVSSSTDPALANDVLYLQTTVSARQIDCTPGLSASC